MQIENGTYKAKAKGWQLSESSKGTPEVAVEFQLTHPELNNFTITWDGWLSDATFDRTVESLRHCGWKGSDFNDLTGLDTNEVELVIENEPFEGKTYSRVKWVNAPGGGLAFRKAMDPGKTASFAAAMNAKIKALEASKGQKKPAPVQAKAPPIPEWTEKDVPF